MPTKLISIRIDTELLGYLQKRAEKEHRTLSNMIIAILSDGVEPVRHGYWKPVTMSELTGWNPEYAGCDPVGCYVCSCCGVDNFVNDVGENILSNYCPHCGAKMVKTE